MYISLININTMNNVNGHFNIGYKIFNEFITLVSIFKDVSKLIICVPNKGTIKINVISIIRKKVIINDLIIFLSGLLSSTLKTILEAVIIDFAPLLVI